VNSVLGRLPGEVRAGRGEQLEHGAQRRRAIDERRRLVGRLEHDLLPRLGQRAEARGLERLGERGDARPRARGEGHRGGVGEHVVGRADGGVLARPEREQVEVGGAERRVERRDREALELAMVRLRVGQRSELAGDDARHPDRVLQGVAEATLQPDRHGADPDRGGEHRLLGGGVGVGHVERAATEREGAQEGRGDGPDERRGAHQAARTETGMDGHGEGGSAQKFTVTDAVTLRGIGVVAKAKPRTSVLWPPAFVSGIPAGVVGPRLRLRPAIVSVAPLAERAPSRRSSPASIRS
jgi:hypothetical protein